MMTTAQIEGTACALCGRPVGPDESVPVELPGSGVEVRVCRDAAECGDRS